MSKRVSFDLDGTIIDSQLSVQNAMFEALAQIDKSIDFVPSNGESLDKLLTKIGLTEQKQYNLVKEKFINLYDSKYCLDTSVYPGIFDLLQRLRQDGFVLNLITNKRQQPTKKIIEYFALQSLFENICCIDTLIDCDTKKKMLDKYLCENSMNIYIGDLYQDYLAAKTSGYKFYHVDWGYGSQSDEYETYDYVGNLYNAIKLAWLKEGP